PGGAGENVSADQRVLSGEHMPELEHHPVPPAPAGWRNRTLDAAEGASCAVDYVALPFVGSRRRPDRQRTVGSVAELLPPQGAAEYWA
ncbi:MAG TPA: hypothetical protein VG099_22140, partial [Gemmataceae bacterium]|nr:hypothetical protein [Gemmataceae bacterium]